MKKWEEKVEFWGASEGKCLVSERRRRSIMDTGRIRNMKWSWRMRWIRKIKRRWEGMWR